MPGSTRYSQGNIIMESVLYNAALAVPNLPANSTVQTTYALPGVLPLDCVTLVQQSYVAGIGIEYAYCTTAGSLIAIWSNTTTGAINGTPAQPFLINVARGENANLGSTGGFPAAIV